MPVKAAGTAACYKNTMPPPATTFTDARLECLPGPARVVAGEVDPGGAQRWFLFAVGSLVLAGLLSLLLVVGRIPVFGAFIADPLFFKRGLVVHVDLALIVWFQAGTAAFLGLALGRTIPRGAIAAALAVAFAGVVAMLLAAGVPGAEPILANYVPVIDHPLYLAGLGGWFVGAGIFFAAALLAPARAEGSVVSDDARAFLRTAAAANLLALVTFAGAWRTTPSSFAPLGYYETLFWGGGHVLQAANVAAMLALWLWLLRRWSGAAVLSPVAARWLGVALVLPHAALPFFAFAGTTTTSYLALATALMRWTIFPVTLVVLGLGLRHYVLHRRGAPAGRGDLLAGLAGSAVLTLLGFILGAMIRGSSTLVPGHYHCAIGAVTIILMAAGHEFCRVMAPAGAPSARLARWQLLLFGAGQAVFGLGFALAGAYGLGRKQYGAEQHVRSLGEHLGLGVMGLGGLVAVAGGLLFLFLMLRSFTARPARPARISP